MKKKNPVKHRDTNMAAHLASYRGAGTHKDKKQSRLDEIEQEELEALLDEASNIEPDLEQED